MQGTIVRWVLNVIGLAVADWLLSGISVDDSLSFFVTALVLGFVNAVVRPLAILFTLPATVLTMGLFLWVINGAMLALVAWIVPTFHVAGLWSAMVGSLVIGAVAWAGNLFIGPAGRVEVITIRGTPPPGPDRLDR